MDDITLNTIFCNYLPSCIYSQYSIDKLMLPKQASISLKSRKIVYDGIELIEEKQLINMIS